jgi:hypothetical protein
MRPETIEHWGNPKAAPKFKLLAASQVDGRFTAVSICKIPESGADNALP